MTSLNYYIVKSKYSKRLRKSVKAGKELKIPSPEGKQRKRIAASKEFRVELSIDDRPNHMDCRVKHTFMRQYEFHAPKVT